MTHGRTLLKVLHVANPAYVVECWQNREKNYARLVLTQLS